MDVDVADLIVPQYEGPTVASLSAQRKSLVRQIQALHRDNEACVGITSLDSLKKCHLKSLNANAPTLQKKFETCQNTLIAALMKGKIECDLDSEYSLAAVMDSVFIKINAWNEYFFGCTGLGSSLVNQNSPNPLSVNRSETLVKLSRLPIPTFDGDNICSFPGFWEAFCSLVDQNADMSDLDKLHYLRSALSGIALEAIQYLPLSSKSYGEAKEILKARFINKKLIVKEHLEILSNLPEVSTRDATRLRSLFSRGRQVWSALTSLEITKSQIADILLSDFIFRKLDLQTSQEIQRIGKKSILPFEDILTHGEDICSELEALTVRADPLPQERKYRGEIRRNVSRSSISATKVNNTGEERCLFCTPLVTHSLFKCPTLGNMDPLSRYKLAKKLNICINCLQGYHEVASCRSSQTCRVCQKKHHSLLHFSQHTKSADPSSQEAFSAATNCTSPVRQVTLLPTASCLVHDKDGHRTVARILLDSGSQVNLISQAYARYLQLPISLNQCIEVQGLSVSDGKIASLGQVACVLCPKGKPDQTFSFVAHVIPKLPSLPRVNHTLVPNIPSSKLADDGPPTSKIDLIVGVDLFWKLVRPSTAKQIVPGALVQVQSVFGWLLTGTSFPSSCQTVAAVTLPSLKVRDFWDSQALPVETRPESTKRTSLQEDQQVEEVFRKTVLRLPDGRLQVDLPFVKDPTLLGESYKGAARRFYAQERRLMRNPKAHEKYNAQLREYLEEGQMELVPSSEIFQSPSYYIPHHAVFKTADEAKESPRVVFDASFPSSNGVSLNDVLAKGPKILADLMNILLRFRLYPFVVTADIKAMYRQFRVNPHHQNFQRILWRSSPDKPLLTYRLKVVTFGVTSSPFLAIRAIHLIADECEKVNPALAHRLRTDMYVDDLCTGASSKEEIRIIEEQLTTLFANYGLKLHKWCSSIDREGGEGFETEESKILGLRWQQGNDSLTFRTNFTPSLPYTKRSVLSTLMKIYDPLGLLSPVILTAKLLLRDIWSIHISWDDPLPSEHIMRWQAWIADIESAPMPVIPRFVACHEPLELSLHGFADASLSAYGAVVYLRCVPPEGQPIVYLLCAKSRIAPKKALTVPRLELCAAVLLAKLIHQVKTALFYTSIHSIYAWSDSSITLCRIQSPAVHNLTSFELNRINLIRRLLPLTSWHFISTKSNPADFVTRGTTFNCLVNTPLWWEGPSCLHQDNYVFVPFDSSTFSTHNHHQQSLVVNLPIHNQLSEPVLHMTGLVVNRKNEDSAVHLTSNNIFFEVMSKYSSLNKVQGVVVYVFRFCKLCPYSWNGPPSPDEYRWATCQIAKGVQKEAFPYLQGDLQAGTYTKTPKPLRQLSPFIDNEGVIRVGGRLDFSKLDQEAKHPILLPSQHRLSQLIIWHFHKITGHSRSNTLVATIRQQFWILSIKKAIRGYLKDCVPCIRLEPRPCEQLMASLPFNRVNPVVPFSSVGVDYGGPFIITTRKKGANTQKAYLCLFVCLCTKAVHLEVTSSLTAEAFLAAFRRFIARRGNCTEVRSDNSPTFKAAARLLFQAGQHPNIRSRVKWSFNPPYAPSTGGIWEIAIKSAKRILTRVAGRTPLTFEELSTLFTEIEATLNTRPLYAASNDPNEPQPLTPAHFLTPKPPTSLWHTMPEVNSGIPSIRHWRRLQSISRQIWKRWSKEYLHYLQIRAKWLIRTKPLKPGQVVLLTDPGPPLYWRLGRVIRMISGADGLARVAEIKVQGGNVIRHVSTLCPWVQEGGTPES